MEQQRRSNGKVARLPGEQKDVVEQMLLQGVTYREIVEYLKGEGQMMSQQAVSNYAKRFLAEAKMLNIAQANCQMMMEELNKYPSLDITEAMLRILSNRLLGAISNKEDKKWDNIALDKLIRECVALTRAVSHKRRVDMQARSEFDASVAAARSLIFDAMSKDDPELYRRLNEYLSARQRQAKENSDL